MTWNKKVDKLGVWEKPSDLSNNWTLKTNKLGTWVAHQINVIHSSLFKHRFCFGTYILGSLVYNGSKQNWLKNVQVTSNWTKKLDTSGTWTNKESPTSDWSKSSEKTNTWVKKTDEENEWHSI